MADAEGERKLPVVSARRVRIAIMAFLVVLSALLGGIVATGIYHALREPTTPTVTERVRDTASVVVAIRDLARLETTSYHIERVIDLSQEQSRFFGLMKAKDAILLVASGDVSAGIDLTTMRDGDITIDRERKRARLTLPQPQILSTRINNERTYVHSRQTDLLATRDEKLESRARVEAQKAVSMAALESGILERAKQNAARTVTTLVRSLGYDEVEIDWQKQ